MLRSKRNNKRNYQNRIQQYSYFFQARIEYYPRIINNDFLVEYYTTFGCFFESPLQFILNIFISGMNQCIPLIFYRLINCAVFSDRCAVRHRFNFVPPNFR